MNNDHLTLRSHTLFLEFHFVLCVHYISFLNYYKVFYMFYTITFILYIFQVWFPSLFKSNMLHILVFTHFKNETLLSGLLYFAKVNKNEINKKNDRDCKTIVGLNKMRFNNVLTIQTSSLLTYLNICSGNIRAVGVTHELFWSIFCVVRERHSFMLIKLHM